MKHAKIFQALNYWPTYLLLKFFVKFEVFGQENLCGLENEAIILTSNHCSWFDGPIAAASLPRASLFPKKFFPIRFLVMERFFHWKYLAIAAYIRLNGSIKVPDGAKRDAILQNAIVALKSGHKLWVYPEGGWDAKNQGRLRRGRKGVMFLHRETGAKIVPVGIIGNYGLLHPRTLLRKNKVVVNIGKPIVTLDDPGYCTLKDGVETVMARIQDLINNSPVHE
jgi:1-acyl-sn-glycerol-3-phosphate acyltransferase